MDFKPEEKIIKDLLVSGHQFEIPLFQRAYSWEKRHYAEFLRDIISNLKVSDGVISVNPYFVGTMLFIGNFVDANYEVKTMDAVGQLDKSMRILQKCYNDDMRRMFHTMTYTNQAIRYFKRLPQETKSTEYLKLARDWLVSEKKTRNGIMESNHL